MVEVLMSAVVGELSAWQTKWETNGQTFFYKYKDDYHTRRNARSLCYFRIIQPQIMHYQSTKRGSLGSPKLCNKVLQCLALKVHNTLQPYNYLNWSDNLINFRTNKLCSVSHDSHDLPMLTMWPPTYLDQACFWKICHSVWRYSHSGNQLLSAELSCLPNCQQLFLLDIKRPYCVRYNMNRWSLPQLCYLHTIYLHCVGGSRWQKLLWARWQH